MPNQKPGSDTPNSEPTVAIRSSRSILPDGGQHAERNGDDQRQDQRRQRQFDGRRQAFADDVDDGPAVEEATGRNRRARRCRRKTKKRSWMRPVEPHVVPQRRFLLGRDRLSRPSMISTGSPGVSVIIRKTITLTPSRTGTSWSSRSTRRPMLIGIAAPPQVSRVSRRRRRAG